MNLEDAVLEHLSAYGLHEAADLVRKSKLHQRQSAKCADLLLVSVEPISFTSIGLRSREKGCLSEKIRRVPE
jgi:hypothetical protein